MGFESVTTLLVSCCVLGFVVCVGKCLLVCLNLIYAVGGYCLFICEFFVVLSSLVLLVLFGLDFIWTFLLLLCVWRVFDFAWRDFVLIVVSIICNEHLLLLCVW